MVRVTAPFGREAHPATSNIVNAIGAILMTGRGCRLESQLSHSRRQKRWSARRASETPRRWNGPAGRLLAPGIKTLEQESRDW